jgi:RND family efflux transporter MFP subunit
MPDTLPNALLIARRAFLAATVWGASWAQAAPLAVAPVQTQAGGARYAAEAVVEAVRESQMAAQVMGRITDVLVHAGERVQAGQVLLRIDPSVAGEQVAASRAQVAQAEAMLAAARTDYTRAQRLHDKQYLSDAALEKARAQFLAAQAQAQALTAQAQASGAQAAFYTLRAPYAGWVSRVDVSQGDQAAPGRALLTVYDPTALRVSASVPESVVRQIDRKAAPAIALPDGPAVTPSGPLEVLPGLDPVSHSATVRVAVKATEPEAMPVPGQFARLSLVLQPAADRAADVVARATLWVPRAAVVQRGELSAVYVVDAAGKASLRQVRLGEPQGDQIEVLAGVQRGENVALDPVAAARQGQPGAR